MTVLVVGPGPTWSTADVEAGLVCALESAGVRVVRYSLGARLNAAERWLLMNWTDAVKARPELPKPTKADVLYEAGRGAVERALGINVDAVVAVSGLLLHPAVLTLLRRAGVPVAVLLTESPYEMTAETLLAGQADLIWTTERTAVEPFKAHCRRVEYLRHGWYPGRHVPGAQPGDDELPAHDVVFVGTGFQERVDFLSAMDWTGIDFGLYGHWSGTIGGPVVPGHPLQPHLRGGEVANVTATALYRRAKLGLNLYRQSCGWGPTAPRLPDGVAESLSPRAYELAACGVPHLSTFRAEVVDTFGPLVPIVTTPAETSKRIRQWLADDAVRAAVGQALPSLVARDSWPDRAGQLTSTLQDVIRARPRAAAH